MRLRSRLHVNGKAHPFGRTASELLAIKFPPRTDLLPRILPRRGSGQIIAPPFHNKTRWLMQLAVAVATPGGMFLGVEPLHGPVVLILYELSTDEAQARLRSALGNHECPDRLRIVTREDKFPCEAEGGQKKLQALCERHKPVLIGIDSFTDWRPERRSAQWFNEDKRTMDELRKLGYAHDTFILLPHHDTRKASDDPTRAAQGSQGLGAGGSAMLKIVWRMGSDKGTLIVTGNEVPPGKIPLRWDKDTLLWSLGDPVKSGAPDTKKQAAKDKLLELLKEGSVGFHALKEIIVDDSKTCSLRTLKEAKKELGIVSTGKGNYTNWELPKPKLNLKNRKSSARVNS